MKIIYVRNLEAIFLTVTPEFFTKIYNLIQFPGICKNRLKGNWIKQQASKTFKLRHKVWI